MRKLSLLTAVLLLSCAWAVAQTSPSSPDSTQNPSSTQPSAQNPSSTSPSTSSPSTSNPSSTMPQSQQPETSATSHSGSEKGNAVEGCLSGSAGNFTITDASGTTYQLAGDTSKLSDHVGHEVKVWGESGGSSASASGATSSASSQPTLNVTKVKMISSSCSTKK